MWSFALNFSPSMFPFVAGIRFFFLWLDYIPVTKVLICLRVHSQLMGI